MRKRPPSAIPAVLTIAGSDSGGGAGIQADLKTFAAFRVFGTSAITCVTAQNPDEVRGIKSLSPEMVSLQVRTVCAGFPVAAAKTGMLYSASIIRATAAAVAECRIPNVVVDPVMISTSGARLLREDAVSALCRDLFPRARVVTPNLDEAEMLLGRRVATLAQLKDAARDLSVAFGVPFVIKGGHLRGRRVTDVLSEGHGVVEFHVERVRAAETHGTGCTFSAAVAACLALNRPLSEAVRRAQRFVACALQRAAPVGKHRPLAMRALSCDA